MTENRPSSSREIPSTAPDKVVNELTGRVIAVRKHKQTVFCDIFNGLSKTQAVFENVEGDFSLKLGDFVACNGEPKNTKTGQKSVFIESYQLLCRPEEYVGEDLELREVLLNRAKSMAIIRKNLLETGAIEVDSKTMSPYSGTANIVPFSTQDIEGDISYLRFTMELELKKYLCRTQLPVFEVGKLYRNLGTSNRRETEFTAVEAYIPYMSLDEGLVLMRKILKELGDEFSIDLSNLSQDEVLRILNPNETIDVNTLNEEDRETYNKKIKRTKRPQILLNQPSNWASPFTKQNADGTACDAKFVYAGAGSIMHINEESGNYQQVLQKLLVQFEQLKIERPSAQLDLGFLDEFKRGLPPCLGLFISFDRLMMTLMKKETIKEVIPGKLVV